MNAITTTAPSVPVPAVAQALSGQYLTFLLHGGTYAMALEQVREIIEFGNLTTVPRMPPFVRGVMNLRGAVLPVVDLGARLGLAAVEVSRKTCVVILELPGDDTPLLVGALVDAVCEVAEFAPADIQPVPSFGTGIDDRFMQGMIRNDSHFIILLHTCAALSPRELTQLAGIVPGEPATS